MRSFTFPARVVGVAILAAALVLVTHFVAGPDLAAKGGHDRHVKIMDTCGPDFNMFVGPDTCSRSHGTHFLDFIAEVTQFGSAHHWRFDPEHDNAEVGDTLVARNHGGEFHTFTEVEEFGGGFVQDLNDLAGVFDPALLTPRTECLTLPDEDFLPPGGTDREDVVEEGTLKFQCCIHPWMQYKAHVKKKKK